ncbi:hypothetical protein O181_009915 [Austropuccinia psidii MF-1]|uniref:Uncharacterized protein n=1 Tax=Austropuccinia psidii MF-1 TaxID=1389203 RepID=A0A9Q3GKD4_9BASI|nr:hypothetical protein [Austropuccinia psidii MF-1]
MTGNVSYNFTCLTLNQILYRVTRSEIQQVTCPVDRFTLVIWSLYPGLDLTNSGAIITTKTIPTKPCLTSH